MQLNRLTEVEFKDKDEERSYKRERNKKEYKPLIASVGYKGLNLKFYEGISLDEMSILMKAVIDHGS